MSPRSSAFNSTGRGLSNSQRLSEQLCQCCCGSGPPVLASLVGMLRGFHIFASALLKSTKNGSAVCSGPTSHPPVNLFLIFPGFSKRLGCTPNTHPKAHNWFYLLWTSLKGSPTTWTSPAGHLFPCRSALTPQPVPELPPRSCPPRAILPGPQHRAWP